MAIIRWIFVVLLCCGTAFGGEPAKAEQEKPAVNASRTNGWLPAATGKSGNVIAVQMDYDGTGEGHKAGTETAEVQSPYAILVLCRSEQPQKAFYVFDNVNKKYSASRDFGRFLEAVKSLPDGVELEWMCGCTVSNYKDLPDAQREKIENTLKQKKFNVCSMAGYCACLGPAAIRFMDIPSKSGTEKCEWK